MGYRGLVRVREFAHRLGAPGGEGGEKQGKTQDVYRIQDLMVVTAAVEEWRPEGQAWVPFHADDIQIEFTMLDPHLRATMHMNAEVSKRERERERERE